MIWADNLPSGNSSISHLGQSVLLKWHFISGGFVCMHLNINLMAHKQCPRAGTLSIRNDTRLCARYLDSVNFFVSFLELQNFLISSNYVNPAPPHSRRIHVFLWIHRLSVWVWDNYQELNRRFGFYITLRRRPTEKIAETPFRQPKKGFTKSPNNLKLVK